MNKQQQELRKKSPIQIKNKKAAFEYFFVEEYTAGIVLTGTEIKSIRAGKASLVDTFCSFINGELWVRNMHISEYAFGTYNTHEERRERKLLLTKKELKKLQRASEDTGVTIVPIRVFFNEKGFAKMEIALAKGKQLHDKRDSLKEKDLEREFDKNARSSKDYEDF